MGSAAPTLQGVELFLVRMILLLTDETAQSLIQPITIQEIDAALSGIDISKAPWLDGLNNYFF